MSCQKISRILISHTTPSHPISGVPIRERPSHPLKWRATLVPPGLTKTFLINSTQVSREGSSRRRQSLQLCSWSIPALLLSFSSPLKKSWSWKKSSQTHCRDQLRQYHKHTNTMLKLAHAHIIALYFEYTSG